MAAAADPYVVDGGKHRIILGALMTPADVTESRAMRDLLWRICFRRKIWPHQITGDAKFGTIANIVAVEDAVCNACPVNAKHTTSDNGRKVHRKQHDAEIDAIGSRVARVLSDGVDHGVPVVAT